MFVKQHRDLSGLWVTETIGTLWISESGRIAGSVEKVGDDWKITEMRLTPNSSA